MLASLNHPQHRRDLRHRGSRPASRLVMELVEGETLVAATCARGADLPLDEALRIARQIAEALEAAHDGHRPSRPQAGEHQGDARTAR